MINLLNNKDKEKVVRAFGEKRCITYGKKTIQMTENFSSETTEVRRNWHVFQAVKEKNCQMQILCPGKLYFRNHGGIQTLSREGKLKEFVTRRHTLKGT